MKTSMLPLPHRYVRWVLASLAAAFTAIPLHATEPRTVPGAGLTLMPIPAGTFTMGIAGREMGDGPATQVTISRPFWLARTEVTQGQWKKLMGTDVVEQARRQLADDARARSAGQPLRLRDGVNRTNVTDPHELVYNTNDDAPIYWVSWVEAVEFCRRLTERERAAGRLPPGYEYRLPTEAEWEYAARAGTTAATYAGDLDEIAWYRGNSSEGYTGKGVNTSASETSKSSGGMAAHRTVATRRPNAWGLYDMLGNVAEWCSDWRSEKLPGGSVRDPTGVTAEIAAKTLTGALRVFRGGSWDSRPGIVNAASRMGNLPGQREISVGFRPALAPSL